MGTVRELRTAPVTTWQQAVDRFLTTRDLAPGSQRVYRLTLEHIGRELATSRLRDLTPEGLGTALSRACPDAAPNTWNRHIATLRSFCALCERAGWIEAGLADQLERRRVPEDHTRVLTPAEIDGLCRRTDVPVRDRCLWRMLSETAARANEVLRLNVEDLDLTERRAVTVRKGGAIDTIHWATGTARLLPYVIAGRKHGPLFLSSRPAHAYRAPAAPDIDPATGLARLSYSRAAQAFTTASGGRTLHQLRHAEITRLAEAGVPLPLLMAKSRHRSLRTLQRYLHPSSGAVARLTEEFDPYRK